MWQTDDYDGVQYDTFWAADPGLLEAAQIRRSIAAGERERLAAWARDEMADVPYNPNAPK